MIKKLQYRINYRNLRISWYLPVRTQHDVKKTTLIIKLIEILQQDKWDNSTNSAPADRKKELRDEHEKLKAGNIYLGK